MVTREINSTLSIKEQEKRLTLNEHDDDDDDDDHWLLGGGLVYTICYRVFLLRFSSVLLDQWFYNGVQWQCCLP
jgi:hypothetical protein